MAYFSDLRTRNVGHFLFDQSFSLLPGGGGGVVLKILLQGHERVGAAAVGYLSAFDQRHEPDRPCALRDSRRCRSSERIPCRAARPLSRRVCGGR